MKEMVYSGQEKGVLEDPQGGSAPHQEMNDLSKTLNQVAKESNIEKYEISAILVATAHLDTILCF